MNRFSLLGSLAMLMTAGIVGCSSPVDNASAGSPLLKGGKSTTTTTAWEVEPNDTPALGTSVIGTASAGGGRQGTISSATDNDYYLTYAVPAGKQFMVNLAMPYAKDYDVQILANDGITVLASNHQGPGMSETLTLRNTSTTAQTYKIRIFSADGSFSTTSPYTLIVGKAS
jgi:hypothetical protein